MGMHNEVAPGQHEISPIFALSNVSADQNALCQDVLSHSAMAHGLTLLLHEKPFAGINGSGKHCNWGLNTDTGKNLNVPGKTKQDQQTFVAFVAALTYAIKNHGDALRASIGHAGNDHRLGAQEAPPAIISLGTGESLENHLKEVIAGGPLDGYGDAVTELKGICSAVADLNARFEDRNRTAPVPFCGNRFEFRAVGSAQNVAFPLAVLNTAVAEGMSKLSSMIEEGLTPRDAVASMLKENFGAIFNGDGYSEEWQVEAAKRGLANLKIGIEAVDKLADAKNVELFEKMHVMSERELLARKEVLLQAYAKDLKSYEGTDLAGERPELYRKLARETAALREILGEADSDGCDARASAFFCLEKLKPQMQVVRELHDTIENKLEAALYPFPNYQQMLFSHHSKRA